MTRSRSEGRAPSVFCAFVGVVAACQPLDALSPPPRPLDDAGATVLVVLQGSKSRIFAYPDVPLFERITVAADARVYAFVYRQGLAELGLDEGPVRAPPPDEGRPLPPTDRRLVLRNEGSGARRWVFVDTRPAEVDRVRLPGLTSGRCAEVGGCYLGEQAWGRRDCALDCAAAVQVDPRPPRIPRPAVGQGCPERFLAQRVTVPMPGGLGLQEEPVFARTCRALPDQDCGDGGFQRAGDPACQPLASCSEPDFAAVLRSVVADGTVWFVGSPPEGAPPGTAVADLPEALERARDGDVLALWDGAHTWPAQAPPAPAVHVVGRCPSSVDLSVPAGVTEGDAQVYRTTVRLEGTDRVFPFRRLESSVLRIDGPSRVDVPAGRMVQFRDAKVLGPGASVRVSGRLNLDGVDWSEPGLDVLEDGQVEGVDLRLRPSGAWVRVLGGRLRVVQSTSRARMSVSGGVLVGRQSHWDGSELGEAPSIEVSAGEADVRDGGFEGSGPWIRIFEEGTGRVRNSWSEGGTPWVFRVSGGRLDVSEMLFFDGGIRVDRGFVRVEDTTSSRSQSAFLFVEDGTVEASRALRLDHGVVVSLRGEGTLELEDAAIRVLRSSCCEPFIVGPVPRRSASERRRRRMRDLECVPGDENVELPNARYLEPWTVRFDRVWVEDLGEAEPLKSVIRTVGTGRLTLRDVFYPRTPGRGLLVQGPIDFRLERVVFRQSLLGSCFFPGLRLEPARQSSVEPAEYYRGTIEGLSISDMPVGLHVQVGPSSAPDVEVSDLRVERVAVGLSHVRAGRKDQFVPPDPLQWQVRAVYRQVGDAVFAASPNLTCD